MSGRLAALSAPRNPVWHAASAAWAGHHGRHTREALPPWWRRGLELVRCIPPPAVASGRQLAAAAVGGLFRLDRLFLGIERGALGCLLTAPRP